MLNIEIIYMFLEHWTPNSFTLVVDVLMVMLFKLDPVVRAHPIAIHRGLECDWLNTFKISNYVHFGWICMIITSQPHGHGHGHGHEHGRTHQHIWKRSLSTYSNQTIKFTFNISNSIRQSICSKWNIKRRREKQNWKDLCRHVFFSFRTDRKKR